MKLSQVPPDQELVVYGRNVSRRYDLEVGLKLRSKGHTRVTILNGRPGGLASVRPPSGTMKSSIWIRVFTHPLVALAFRLYLGGLFVYASLYKINYTAEFAETIASYQLVPYWGVNLLAVILPWIELISGHPADHRYSDAHGLRGHRLPADPFHPGHPLQPGAGVRDQLRVFPVAG